MVLSAKESSHQPQNHRLILGTANFGSQYGLAQSQIDIPELDLIMSEVIQNSDVLIETSPSYRNSEEIIGRYIRELDFNRLVVKVPPHEYGTKKKIIDSVKDSLSRLNQAKATLVMLHGLGPSFGKQAREVERACEELVDSKLTLKVGLSCYTEDEVLYAKKILPMISTFQIPENLADGRTKDSQMLLSMKSGGDTFQVRSIFLQGILTRDINEIPDNLKDVLAVRNYMTIEAKRLDISEQELCIEYVKQIPWMTDIVIGVEKYAQLKFNIKTLFNPKRLKIESGPTANGFSVDPRNWS
jgi:aryl-alcohol dehydrogenase-like predicted oxidoreductase